MYDVFISYSRKDADIANRICKAFDDAGITYFIDRQGIGGAYDFPEVLAEAIISSKIVLYLASNNSYASKFTQSEITFAFNRKSKGSILPYIIDNSSMPISLELVFSSINWRNMKEHPIETVLVDDLLRLLGKERKQHPKEISTDTVGKREKGTRTMGYRNRYWLLTCILALGLMLAIGALLLIQQKDKVNKSPVANVSETEVIVLDFVSMEQNVEDSVESVSAVFNEQELSFTANGVSFTMKYVAPGQFIMGTTEPTAYADEKPAHKVYIEDGFYIGETEVTQMLWEAVMGNNPSAFKGGQRPVEQVSYKDCHNFIERLNELTGNKFRLPTEAEWEFTARGGNMSKNTRYSGSNLLDEVGWYTGNSERHSHRTKEKTANELGVYDMTGNVWEWCYDKYSDKYYSSNDTINPQGPASGDFRVYRGGCWCNDALFSRLTIRGYDSPNYRSPEVGLRLALNRNK